MEMMNRYKGKKCQRNKKRRGQRVRELPWGQKLPFKRFLLVFSRKLLPVNLDFCNRLPPQHLLILPLPHLDVLLFQVDFCALQSPFMCRVAPYTPLPLLPNFLQGLCDPDPTMVQWLCRNIQLSLWDHEQFRSERSATWGEAGLYLPENRGKSFWSSTFWLLKLARLS